MCVCCLILGARPFSPVSMTPSSSTESSPRKSKKRRRVETDDDDGENSATFSVNVEDTVYRPSKSDYSRSTDATQLRRSSRAKTLPVTRRRHLSPKSLQKKRKDNKRARKRKSASLRDIRHPEAETDTDTSASSNDKGDEFPYERMKYRSSRVHPESRISLERHERFKLLREHQFDMTVWVQLRKLLDVGP